MSTTPSAPPPAGTAEAVADPEDSHAAHGGHPTDGQYVKVALILALLTGVEVGVYYISGLRKVLVPILLVLATTKFVMVALWFMHLRFDNRLFRRLFVTGIVLAGLVYFVALTSLHVLSD